MANICDYNVEVRGRRNACYAFYGSMSVYDSKDEISSKGTDDDFVLRFRGDCKWSVDSYCQPFTGEMPVELPEDADEAYNLAEEKYWYHTVQERSKMFGVEVFCVSNDIDDYFPEAEVREHYINGEPVVTGEEATMFEELKVKPFWE